MQQFYMMEYYSAVKTNEIVIYRKIDAPWGHDVKWNKSDPQGSIIMAPLICQRKITNKEKSKAQIMGCKDADFAKMERGVWNGGRGMEGREREWEKCDVLYMHNESPQRK